MALKWLCAIPALIYNFLIGCVEPIVPEKFRPFWEHPAGCLMFSSLVNY